MTDTLDIADEQVLMIGLVSGARFHVQKIYLNDEGQQRKAQALRISAANELTGGTGTLGVLGSPGWALAGAVVLGALRSLASTNAASSSIAMLNEAERIAKCAYDQGAFIPVRHIGNIEFPDPGTWKGFLSVDSNGGPGKSYVHDGGPFIRVLTKEAGFVSLALDKIEVFAPPHPSRLSDEQKMSELGIAFDGKRYCYGGMSYDQLTDAINYAEIQKKKAFNKIP